MEQTDTWRQEIEARIVGIYKGTMHAFAKVGAHYRMHNRIGYAIDAVEGAALLVVTGRVFGWW